VLVAGGMPTRGAVRTRCGVARGDFHTIKLRSGGEATAEVLREASRLTIKIGGWHLDGDPPVVRLVTGESDEPLPVESGAEPGTWGCVVDASPADAAIVIGEAGGES
jgi:hypothetical protein